MKTAKQEQLRVLLVKLTSLGDALHLLPALTDFHKYYPHAKVDWIIEDSFAEIPKWHGAIDQVVSVSTRRWRKLNRANIGAIVTCLKQLRAVRYDVIIDAQGLLKSAAISRLGKLNRGGKRFGFSADSIKEKPAANFYDRQIVVPRQQHAIDRLRQLFSQAFDYPESGSEPNYSICLDFNPAPRQPAILFIPSTTWPSKHLPKQTWRDLIDYVTRDGYQIRIVWGTQAEKDRAQWIAQDRPEVKVLAKSNLTELAKSLPGYAGVVAVDTGIGHLAAALGVPAVSVYGATDAKLTGAIGKSQIHLQCDYPCSPCLLQECDKLSELVCEPPCYGTLAAADIWTALRQKIV